MHIAIYKKNNISALIKGYKENIAKNNAEAHWFFLFCRYFKNAINQRSLHRYKKDSSANNYKDKRKGEQWELIIH